MVVDVVDEGGAAGVVVVVVVAGELSMCEWYVCVISLYLSLASVRSFAFEKKKKRKKNGRSTTTKKRSTCHYRRRFNETLSNSTGLREHVTRNERKSVVGSFIRL